MKDPLDKVCARCRVLKLACEFNSDGSRPDGLYLYCKPCRKHMRHHPIGHALKRGPKPTADNTSEPAVDPLRAMPWILCDHPYIWAAII